MKEKTGLFVGYVLFIVTLFLPWFTYDPKLVGYCWGTQFLPHFVIPTALIAVYLFRAKTSIASVILAEIGAVMDLAFLVIIFATWQESRNIIEGFHWKDGFHTAQPGFWLSFVLSVVFFIMLQIQLYSKKRSFDKES